MQVGEPQAALSPYKWSGHGVVRRRIVLWRRLWIPKWRIIRGFRRFNWVLRRWRRRIFDGGRLGISRLRLGWGSAGRGLGIKASTLKERRKFTRRGLVSGSVTFRTLARGPLVSPTDPKQDLCHFNIDVYLRQLRISAVRIFVEIGTKHVRISTVLDAVPEGELTFGDFSIRCG